MSCASARIRQNLSPRKGKPPVMGVMSPGVSFNITLDRESSFTREEKFRRSTRNRPHTVGETPSCDRLPKEDGSDDYWSSRRLVEDACNELAMFETRLAHEDPSFSRSLLTPVETDARMVCKRSLMTSSLEGLRSEDTIQQQRRAHRTGSTVHMLHFSDTAELDPAGTGPSGGIARFKTALKRFGEVKPLMFLTGDVMASSQWSVITRGKHIVPFLNTLGVECALFGPQDFAFGAPVLRKITQHSLFPWVLSNVLDGDTGRPLGDALPHTILNWNDLRVGVMGLVSPDFIRRRPYCPSNTCTEAMDVCARAIMHYFHENRVQVVVCLACAEEAELRSLVRDVPGIDVIFVGGSKEKRTIVEDNCRIIYSGASFEAMTHVRLDITMPAEFRTYHLKMRGFRTFDEVVETAYTSAEAEKQKIAIRDNPALQTVSSIVEVDDLDEDQCSPILLQILRQSGALIPSAVSISSRNPSSTQHSRRQSSIIGPGSRRLSRVSVASDNTRNTCLLAGSAASVGSPGASPPWANSAATMGMGAGMRLSAVAPRPSRVTSLGAAVANGGDGGDLEMPAPLLSPKLTPRIVASDASGVGAHGTAGSGEAPRGKGSDAVSSVFGHVPSLSLSAPLSRDPSGPSDASPTTRSPKFVSLGGVHENSSTIGITSLTPTPPKKRKLPKKRMTMPSRMYHSENAAIGPIGKIHEGSPKARVPPLSLSSRSLRPPPRLDRSMSARGSMSSIASSNLDKTLQRRPPHSARAHSRATSARAIQTLRSELHSFRKKSLEDSSLEEERLRAMFVPQRMDMSVESVEVTSSQMPDVDIEKMIDDMKNVSETRKHKVLAVLPCSLELRPELLCRLPTPAGAIAADAARLMTGAHVAILHAGCLMRSAVPLGTADLHILSLFGPDGPPSGSAAAAAAKIEATVAAQATPRTCVDIGPLSLSDMMFAFEARPLPLDPSLTKLLVMTSGRVRRKAGRIIDDSEAPPPEAPKADSANAKSTESDADSAQRSKGDRRNISSRASRAMSMSFPAQLPPDTGGPFTSDPAKAQGHSASTSRGWSSGSSRRSQRRRFGSRTWLRGRRSDVTVVCVNRTGAEIRQVLEEGFAKLPNPYSLFPMLSGMQVSVDVKAEPGKRVGEVLLGPDSEGNFTPMHDEQTYTVATMSSSIKGDGGSQALRDVPVVGGPLTGLPLSLCVRRYFERLWTLDGVRSHMEPSGAVTMKRVLLRRLAPNDRIPSVDTYQNRILLKNDNAIDNVTVFACNSQQRSSLSMSQAPATAPAAVGLQKSPRRSGAKDRGSIRSMNGNSSEPPMSIGPDSWRASTAIKAIREMA